MNIREEETHSSDSCFHQRLFVAVHAGAGYHSQEKASQYRKVCREACLQAISLLRRKQSACDAAVAAVSVLEDSELTNAGRGSSLTLCGSVECDAGVMDGMTSRFGAVGCLSGVLNPITVAHRLLHRQQSSPLSLGRVPPSVLVGEMARQWAREQGFSCDDHSKLITDNCKRLYRKYKRRLEKAEADLSRNQIQVINSNQQGHASKNSLFSFISNSASSTAEVSTDPQVAKRIRTNDWSLDDQPKASVFENEAIVGQQQSTSNSISTHLLRTSAKDFKEISNINKHFQQQDLEASNAGLNHFVPPKQASVCSASLDHQCKGAATNADLHQTMPGENSVSEGPCPRVDDKSDVESQRFDESGVDTPGYNMSGAGDSSVQDTVGAICIDWQGNVSVAASSGGIWLKQAGRLGPAAMYGAGCWAQNESKGHPGVAVIASGCGEQLMRTLLAKTCAECLLSCEGASEGMRDCFTKHFLDSWHLTGEDSRVAGAVGVVFSSSLQAPELDVCWGHTSESMALGYMRGDFSAPKTQISRLNDTCQSGKSFTMSGTFLQ